MRPMKLALPLALILVVGALGAPGALAARGLDEPASLGKVVKGARGTDVSTALAATGVPAGCKDALGVADLAGLACRGAVASALVRARPLAAPADLSARVVVARDLARAADAVVAYAPLSPPPGFARARFDALAALGRAAMASYDELALAPATHPLAAPIATALAEPPVLRKAACGAVQHALDAAGPAGAGMEESGALLGLVTSHRCLVDDERLSSKPKPAALTGSDDAKRVAAAAGADAAIADYLSSRELELERCGKHLDAAGRPLDVEKTRACLCGVIERWRFPPRAAGARSDVPFRRALLSLQLDERAAVSTCGPVRSAP